MTPKTLVEILLKDFSQQGISACTNISQGHISKIKAGVEQGLREDGLRRCTRADQRKALVCTAVEIRSV